MLVEYEDSGTAQKEDVKKTPIKMLPPTPVMLPITLSQPWIASLARHQANAVEFATKFASHSSMAQRYKRKIVQHVAPQKLAMMVGYDSLA